MNKLNFLTLLISSLVLWNCTKDNTIVEETGETNSEFVIGQTEPGNYTSHLYTPASEISSWSNGGSVTDTIDLYDDQINDFVIVSYGSKWAETRISSIVSLNYDVKILSLKVVDTLWLTAQNTNPLVNFDTVVYNSYSGFNSGQTNDSILDVITDYYPQQFEVGSSGFIENSNNLWQDIGLFSNFQDGVSYASPNVFYTIRKGDWNNAGNTYLCFKLDDGDQVKYGWIKLNITNDYSVSVLEYAIQN